MGVIRGPWAPVFNSPGPSASQTTEESILNAHMEGSKARWEDLGGRWTRGPHRGLRKQKPRPALQRAGGSLMHPMSPHQRLAALCILKEGHRRVRGHRSVVCKQQQLDPTATPVHPPTCPTAWVQRPPPDHQSFRSAEDQTEGLWRGGPRHSRAGGPACAVTRTSDCRGRPR